MARQAFATLITSDDYVVGALVLAHSLRDSATTRDLVVLVTEHVSGLSRGRLADVFDHVILVEPIRTTSTENLLLLGRPELALTFTKIRVWQLVQYEKIIFVDADTLVLSNVDELFERPEISAVSDVGWPDCFNSGLFVLVPSEATFAGLVEHASTHGSFDGGDQGLLNSYFSNWSLLGPEHRIPFTFNTVATSVYSYAPAYRHFREHLRIVHFIGPDKPWRWTRHTDGNVTHRPGTPSESRELVQLWWNVHDRHIARWNEPVPASSSASSSSTSLYQPSSGTFSNVVPAETYQPVSSSEPTASNFSSYRVQWDEDALAKKPKSASPEAVPKTQN